MDSHEDVAEQPPFITESWSDDGLKLTVTGRYPNGVEADVSTTWATREAAEANADSARSGAEKMLRTRRFDLEAEEGTQKE